MRNYKKIYSGLLSIALMFSSGCTLLQKIEEHNPVNTAHELTCSQIDQKKLQELYDKYFPNNRPGLSLGYDTKKYAAEFFINPKTSYKEDLEFEISSGFEIKY